MTSESLILALGKGQAQKVRPYAARLLHELRRCAAEATAIPEGDRAQILAHLDGVRALLLPCLDQGAEGAEEVGEVVGAGADDARWSDAYNALEGLVGAMEAKAGMRAGGYRRRIEAGICLKLGVSDVTAATGEALEARVAGLAALLERSPTEIAEAMDKLLVALKARAAGRSK